MPASQPESGAGAPASSAGAKRAPVTGTGAAEQPDAAQSIGAGAAGSAPPGSQPREGAGARPASLLQLVQELLREIPGLVSDRVHLLALEIKRAALALAWIAALGFAALLLGITAWFALWAGLAFGAVQAGLHWAWAFAIVLLINLAAAAWAVMRILKLAPLLALPASMRRLAVPRGSPSASAPASSTTKAPGHDRPEPVAERAAARP